MTRLNISELQTTLLDLDGQHGSSAAGGPIQTFPMLNTAELSIEQARSARGHVKLEKHGSPRCGISLAAVTEARGKMVREAVLVLSKGFSEDSTKSLYVAEFSVVPKTREHDSRNMRAAWSLVMIHLMARSHQITQNECSLEKAEVWFVGANQGELLSRQVSKKILAEAELLLNSIQLDQEFYSLLPYILEEHGPGSRASVLRDPGTASARAAKREAGVFYTPADVADYMVEHARGLYPGHFLTAKALDPACGTGVFLLAMLRAAIRSSSLENEFSRYSYVTTCIHGMDISGHALDASAFVLLHECLSETEALGVSPLTAWQRIRLNLVETDALLVDSIARGPQGIFFEPSLPSLSLLFPQIEGGFDILVGNPPYAALGDRKDFATLAARFASLQELKAAPRLNLFPLFIEMMWRFTKPGLNASALVTPLSIAYHGGAQYENCRHAMSSNGGRWQCAFFDREPHALFGEEVKTRNAILFRHESAATPNRGQAANVETGPLRKWTSRTRARLFKDIVFTPVDSIDITSSIPKLDGSLQSDAFLKLRCQYVKLSSFALRIGTCNAGEALTGGTSPAVFVGGTAYNFLNVYRPTNLRTEARDYTLSESPVHCLKFQSEAHACVAFAVLCSRLSFWMWHVLGDGFHVASWFLKEIPVASDELSQDDFELLAEHGELLWGKIQTQQFISNNAGKLTIGFRPLAFQDDLDEIDAILIRILGLNGDFKQELRTFVQRNAIVDLSDERRSKVRDHFYRHTHE